MSELKGDERIEVRKETVPDGTGIETIYYDAVTGEVVRRDFEFQVSVEAVRRMKGAMGRVR